jgi:hypothetical protein
MLSNADTLLLGEHWHHNLKTNRALLFHWNLQWSYSMTCFVCFRELMQEHKGHKQHPCIGLFFTYCKLACFSESSKNLFIRCKHVKNWLSFREPWNWWKGWYFSSCQLVLCLVSLIPLPIQEIHKGDKMLNSSWMQQIKVLTHIFRYLLLTGNCVFKRSVRYQIPFSLFIEELDWKIVFQVNYAAIFKT